MNKSRSEKKRKRDSVALKKKFESKRQKLEQKLEEICNQEDKIEENSDLGDNDEYFEVDNVAEVLSARDKVLLRQDPFNQNFAATTWTNEFTLLKANSEFYRWKLCNNGHSYIFPLEVFHLITSHCDPVTLRRLSKPMNALVVQSDDLWRTHFYSRRWKLRQDLENGFCGVEPIDEDKSEWVNVIPDDQVDWFGEYRRNHINSYFIRTLVGEITTKLQKIVDEYGVVKSEVTEAGEQPLFFSQGLTDDDIDDQNDSNTPITNDMRELFKCCSGKHFFFKKDADIGSQSGVSDINDAVPPNIPVEAFPVITDLSYAQLENMEASGWYCSDSSDGEIDPYPPSDLVQEREQIPPKSDALAMDSDSEDYEPSQLSYDSGEEERSGIEEFIKSNKGKKHAKRGLFGYHRPLVALDDGNADNNNDEDEGCVQYYDVQTGSLTTNQRSYGCVSCTMYPSIVDYLQEVSDFLDSPLAPFCVEFEDYYLIEWKESETELIKDIEDVEFGLGTKRWVDLIRDVGNGLKTDLYFSPRAIKLLAAAAQDTIVKVFQRAQELETSDELQPNTFQRAAKEVSHDTQKHSRRPLNRSTRCHLTLAERSQAPENESSNNNNQPALSLAKDEPSLSSPKDNATLIVPEKSDSNYPSQRPRRSKPLPRPAGSQSRYWSQFEAK